MANYPVGKAQKRVLDALIPGNGIQYWTTAERTFEDLGIVVSSKRVGRSVEPVIRLKTGQRAEWNDEGDADVWEEKHGLTAEQLQAIEQWIAK